MHNIEREKAALYAKSPLYGIGEDTQVLNE